MSRRERMRQKIEREADNHEDACNCRTCRAANGDSTAMSELMTELL